MFKVSEESTKAIENERKNSDTQLFIRNLSFDVTSGILVVREQGPYLFDTNLAPLPQRIWCPHSRLTVLLRT